ncbi:MAG: non-canonical purine NTP diphosphatase [Bacteroidia bacterium]|nr:non-canonical purine NTP diphosphatase [Bacteroidia bacterium]
MLKKLVFATNNKYKLEEIRQLLGAGYFLLSAEEIGCTAEIPENHDTLEGNAREKAEFIYSRYGYNCFADDTGLEIEALNGKPGVYSARYAGENISFEANIQKVLKEMDGVKNRAALFKTVIHLIYESQHYNFTGIIMGTILHKKRGSYGFGYDPIFQPQGYEKTFAQMTLHEKNKISHRGQAIKKLIDFLK